MGCLSDTERPGTLWEKRNGESEAGHRNQAKEPCGTRAAGPSLEENKADSLRFSCRSLPTGGRALRKKVRMKKKQTTDQRWGREDTPWRPQSRKPTAVLLDKARFGGATDPARRLSYVFKACSSQEKKKKKKQKRCMCRSLNPLSRCLRNVIFPRSVVNKPTHRAVPLKQPWPLPCAGRARHR